MITLTPTQLQRLNSLTFIAGVGHPTSNGHTACLMSAAALVVAIENNDEAGYQETDQLQCVCSVIRKLGIIINDSFQNKEQRKKWAIDTIPKIIGTNISHEVKQKRAYACADAAVRKYAVAALLKAGLQSEADKLAALDPIINQKTCNIAKKAASASYAASYAAADASNAAYAASYAASYDDAASDAAAAYASRAAAYAADDVADVADASKITILQELLDTCLAITE